jgi:hypothetical protein
MPDATHEDERDHVTATGRLRTDEWLVAILLAVGFGAVLALHLFEPRLAVRWSYAHLGRNRILPRAAGLLVVLLPAIAAVAWRFPAGARRARPARTWPTVATWVTATALLAVVFGAIAVRWPPAGLAEDVYYVVNWVAVPGHIQPRWYLTMLLLEAGVALGRPAAPQVSLLRTNAVIGAVAIMAIVGAACTLARSRREAIAIALLAATTFGPLQVAVGYLDIYPTPVAITALYLWAALRVSTGRGHPVWPLFLAAVAPFFYEGLLLLWPSTLVVAAVAARQPNPTRRLATAVACAIATAGLATIPGYGMPFAWRTFALDVAAANPVELGYSTTSSLLPAWYVFSVVHAREVLHTFILVDAVGVWVLVVRGRALLARALGDRDAAVWLLAFVIGPYLTYVVLMDAIFGQFIDWDMFSYGAVATSLLGAYALVLWGRRARLGGALIGLALATNGVHLLARFHALEVGARVHMIESPRHVLPKTK